VRRIVISGVIFVFAATVPAHAQGDDRPAPAAATTDVQQGVARMRSLRDQNRFVEAAQLGEKAAREHPDSVEVWLALAEVHLSTAWPMRREARAESASRRALKAGGRRPETLVTLATALVRETKYDEAQPLLDELLNASPPRVTGSPAADLLVLRANIALRRDALDDAARAQARADLDRALALVPTHASAQALRGEMLLIDGKLEEALADLEAACAACSGGKAAAYQGMVHYQLQICLTRLNRRDEAKVHYEIWSVLNRLNDSIAATNAPDAATRRKLLLRLKQLDPSDLVRRLQLAQIEIELGEFDAAIEECDELLSRRPDWLPARHVKIEARRCRSGARPETPPAAAGDGDGG